MVKCDGTQEAKLGRPTWVSGLSGTHSVIWSKNKKILIDAESILDKIHHKLILKTVMKMGTVGKEFNIIRLCFFKAAESFSLRSGRS